MAGRQTTGPNKKGKHSGRSNKTGQTNLTTQEPCLGGQSKQNTNRVEQQRQTWDGQQAQQTSDGQQAQQTSDGQQEQQTWDGQQEQQTWDGQQEQQTWDGQQEQQTWDGQQEQQTWDGQQEQQTWDSQYEQQTWDGQQAQQTWDGKQEQQTWDGQQAQQTWDGQQGQQTWDGQQEQQTWDGQQEQQTWDGQQAQQTWDGQQTQQTWDGQQTQQTWDGQQEQQTWDGQQEQQTWDGQQAQQTWDGHEENKYSFPANHKLTRSDDTASGQGKKKAVECQNESTQKPSGRDGCQNNNTSKRSENTRENNRILKDIYRKNIASAQVYQDNEDYAVCTLDPSHRPLKQRLAAHLTKCVKACRLAEKCKIMTCPYNSCHVYRERDMEKHMEECDCKDTVYNEIPNEEELKKEKEQRAAQGIEIEYHAPPEIEESEEWGRPKLRRNLKGKENVQQPTLRLLSDAKRFHSLPTSKLRQWESEVSVDNLSINGSLSTSTGRNHLHSTVVEDSTVQSQEFATCESEAFSSHSAAAASASASASALSSRVHSNKNEEYLCIGNSTKIKQRGSTSTGSANINQAPTSAAIPPVKAGKGQTEDTAGKRSMSSYENVTDRFRRDLGRIDQKIKHIKNATEGERTSGNPKNNAKATTSEAPQQSIVGLNFAKSACTNKGPSNFNKQSTKANVSKEKNAQQHSRLSTDGASSSNKQVKKGNSKQNKTTEILYTSVFESFSEEQANKSKKSNNSNQISASKKSKTKDSKKPKKRK